MQGLWRFARRIRTDNRLLVPLLLANAAGMLFGWYYYVDAGQFVPEDLGCNAGGHPFCEPVWAWPLVSDSPNAVALFFAAAVASRWFASRSRVLDAAAFLLNVYVGLWTTLLFTSYADELGTYDVGSVNSILFVTHMGMPAQALTLVPDMRGDRWSLSGVAAVLVACAAYVAVDYWGPMMHPAPHLHPDDAVLHAWSPWLMVAAVALWLVLARPLGRGKAQTIDAGT